MVKELPKESITTAVESGCSQIDSETVCQVKKRNSAGSRLTTRTPVIAGVPSPQAAVLLNDMKRVESAKILP